ncbi:MAG: exodeoxyribonuclease V subunit gamma [Bacillota bacterium]|nr:exodeoxyribonuclease V subunit gamma [Bacillota bacterium]
MIKLIYSNQTERLLETLVKILKVQRSGAHPLDPVELVVPNRNMETWIRLGLAQALGVAANLHFRRLERFIGNLVEEACPGEIKLADLDTVEAAILSILLDGRALDQPDLEPVRLYLDSTGDKSVEAMENQHRTVRPTAKELLAADGADIRRVQLASRLAYLFQEYSFSRPEMIATWRGDRRPEIVNHPFANPATADPSLATTAAWQSALWQSVFSSGGVLDQNPPEKGGRWITPDLLALDDDLFKKISSTELPPVHIFGVSYVARLFQHLFARLGEKGNLFIYTLNPCAEFWEDIETERELFYRLDREKDHRSRHLWDKTGEPAEGQDPFDLDQTENLALRHWGKPGREHIRLLDELTDCDFTAAFNAPTTETDGLLQQLQEDVLRRKADRNPENDATSAAKRENVEHLQPDGTLQLVAAPSVRREVEWVADEIWKLMSHDCSDSPLRFSDIAVIVNSAGRDLYLPQIETVFASCHNLPNSVSDLPGTAGSSLLEAMDLLLQLPFGRFSRTEMLTLICHPAVIGHLGGPGANELAALSEELGIIFGADHEDHAGTYIDEDVYNWDQGLRRLALGSFMSGEKSGTDKVFEISNGRWLVEEKPSSAQAGIARFGLLARSLIADARFVRERKLTLSEWARFYTAQADAYLQAEKGDDEQDRLRLLRALGKLEDMDLGEKVSGRVAAEIARRTIESLGGGRGQYLAEGVVVSSFLPMRAIPFRVIFLLGLGEGLFPATARRDALDLRAARRRAGDVDPAERDRYMFLETLLCTREKLYLSYVKRDEQTGDPLQPSAVVQELLHILKQSYFYEEGLAGLQVDPPLRRFDDPAAAGDTFFDEARAEFHIRKIAKNWREHAYAGEGEWTEPGGSFRESLHRELSAIRKTAAPEAWEALEKMLALPGDPPQSDANKLTVRREKTLLDPDTIDSAEKPVEYPLSLSLSALRRFLECPMQGWAATMLGLEEVEEDPAEREEEDFEINRLRETMLLRGVFFDSLATGEFPEELYIQRAARMRLAGRFPVGSLGRAVEKRHLAIFSGWQSLLTLHGEAGNGRRDENGEYETGKSEDNQGTGIFTGSFAPLHRIRLGRPQAQRPAEKVIAPLSLDITADAGNGDKKVIPVQISGLMEGITGNNNGTVILQAKKPPPGKGKGSVEKSFRYLLKGILDQALLAAADLAGSGERKILILFAGAGGETGCHYLRLRPAEKEKSRRWLATLAEDLLSGPHAYLLPCEAVIREYLAHFSSGRSGPILSALPEDVSIGETMGNNIPWRVKELAGSEWNTFSSLWGPVPAPRSYEPPSKKEAMQIINHRFGPLFSEILSLEVLL